MLYVKLDVTAPISVHFILGPIFTSEIDAQSRIPRYVNFMSKYSTPDGFSVALALGFDMDFEFHGLNYFSAQSVFVPGVKFIEAKTEMMPYNVVLLGAMPEQPEPTGYCLLPRRTVMMSDYATTDPIGDFIDDIYSKGYFLGDLIHHITNNNLAGVKQVIQDRGFTNLDLAEVQQTLKRSSIPGPDFDRVFPWKDSPSLQHPKDAHIGDSARDAEALQYLSVAMDLAAPNGGQSKDGREPVEFAEPITIFFGAVSTTLCYFEYPEMA
ncbi:hypothetical protein BPOR_0249g00100 [Botrytis porri]|uniref:Uncharacterized protein n=1 Tax=Botrytis porri TaxID=87229 RepID=A0A4Z1KNP2_9HELO|nr:hypothetical protein BPOR_0249g00100 [Botrytis porri]